MKKLLILFVVLAMASLAGATTVSIIKPLTGPGSSDAEALKANESLRVYLGIDASDLDTLSVTISATNGTIDGGVLAAEAVNHGLECTDWGVVILTLGGFQSGLSNDTTIISSAAHVGLGQFGSVIYGATTSPVAVYPFAPGTYVPPGTAVNSPIAYIDITAAGTGDMVLSIINGSTHGSTSLLTDLITVPNMTGTIIDAVPEPATMLILGLGALLLRRRK